MDQGSWPRVPSLYGVRQADNYTDSIMLNISVIDTEGSRIHSTLTGLRRTVADADGSSNPTRALFERTALGLPAETTYLTYWHGYVVVMRPLLVLFDTSQVKLLTTLALLGLWTVAGVLAMRRIGWPPVLVAGAATLTLGPFSIANSLAFKVPFLIAAFGVIAVLLLDQRIERDRWLLPVAVSLGIATSFFDFLTAPLLSVGIPLLVLASIDLYDGKRISLRQWAVLLGGWAVSYATFWMAKWVALELVGTRVMDVGFAKIVQRSGADEVTGLSYRLSAVASNFRFMGPEHSVLHSAGTALTVAVTGIVLLAVCCTWLAAMKYSQTDLGCARRALPLLLLSALPYTWYFLAANHSYTHAWFTFRAQYISLVGAGLFVLYTVDWGSLLSRIRQVRTART